MLIRSARLFAKVILWMVCQPASAQDLPYSVRYDLSEQTGSQGGMSIETAEDGYAIFFNQSTPDWSLPGPGVMFVDGYGNVQALQAWADSTTNDLYSGRGGATRTSDNGYALAGVRFHHTLNPVVYNMLLRRLDPQGNTLWMREYGDSVLYYFGEYVLETADWGFLVAGTRSGADSASIKLWKIDLIGDIQWTHVYGVSYGGSVGNVISDGAGGYYLCGSMGVDLCDRQLWLTHLDSLGSPLWTWLGGGPFKDGLKSVTRLSNGDLVVFGNIQHNGCNSLQMRPYCARFNAAGELVWERNIGPIGLNHFQFGGIHADAGSLLGVGAWFDTDHRGWTYQISLDGDSLCSMVFPFVNDSIPNGRGILYDAIVEESGDIVAVGSAMGETTVAGTEYTQDTWFLKASKCELAIPLGVSDAPPTSHALNGCWPNPSTGHLTCAVPDLRAQVVVRDILGRVIRSVPAVGMSQVPIDLSSEPEGIYLVQIMLSGRTLGSQRMEVTH
jgi:hypothetical protein